MEGTHPGGFFKTNWRQIAIGFFSLVIIVITIFKIGGDDFVYAFNSNISSFQALAILILTIILFARMGEKSQNRLLWLGLMIGWVLWTIAEWWWGIASFFQTEAPFPSVADFFWFVGYIPMYIALDSRNRSIPQESSPVQKLIIWLCSIVAIGLTAIFIVNPVIQNYEPGTALETILTLVYPLGDLILFIFVLRIAFRYQEGINGQAWRWIAAGYIVTTVADLIFSYATANDMYYPNGQVNFISSIGSDMLYSLSYMIILMGLAVMRKADIETQKKTEETIDLAAVPNTHVVFFTGSDDLINDVSRNFPAVFEAATAIGQPIFRATGLSMEQAANIISLVKSRKDLTEEQSVTVATRQGIKNARLFGQTITTPEGSYTGMILLLRLFLEGKSPDDSVSDYHRSIIRSMIKKAGSSEDHEIKALLTAYYSLVLKGWIDVVETEGGNLMGHSVSSKLQTIANDSNWEISIDPEGNIDTGRIPLEVVRKNLQEVFEKAREITAEITDAETVNRVEMKIWDSVTQNSRQSLIACGVTPPV